MVGSNGEPGDGMESESAEAGAVRKFLSTTPERWLNVGSPQESAQVREMRQWHALHRACASDLPDIALSPALMTLLCEESGVGGGFLSCTEMSRGGWFGDEADARAAAILGRDGQLETVLVACTFLAHGFDIYGGDGRPLVDGYRFLLPAIASYFAADSGVDLADVGIPPGWWDFAGTGPFPIRPNALTYALNPRLDDARRRGVMGRGPGAVDVWILGPTGRLLGMDLSFLSPDELAVTEATMSELIDDLGQEDPPEDPLTYEAEQLEPMNLGYLVGAFGDSLLEEGPLSSARVATSSLTPSTWLEAWQSWSVMDPELWPYGPLREAIASSPW